MKKIFNLLLAGLLIVTLSSCTKNTSTTSKGNATTTQVTSTGSNTITNVTQILKDKVIDDNMFKNPIKAYRPMVMMHAATTGLVDDVESRGYGGIVTNVSWDRSYLNSTQAFSRLSSVISHAIDDLGMYVWIYDEYGYPSGTAFGQTLKGNPEYEAMGLVIKYEIVAPNEGKTIDLVYGHKEIVNAYLYDGDSEETIDLASYSDVSSLINESRDSITYINRTKQSKVLVTYMSKPWYENTHSMENWYAQQRYINMLDPEPTKKFIDLTYEKYFDNLGEYFGNGIKAFFTDEPALQGSYFNISERNRTVLDTPDPNIPKIECLNYSETLFETFKNAYGYDLRPNLGYLYFEVESQFADQVRMDFYNLTSKLFAENYLTQIAEWCDKHNVKSSGHLLLEEALYQNPWFEGDMIDLLSRMGIPGTDLLHSTANGAEIQSCIVSRMASSAADFTGKTETFAEVSGAFDGTMGDVYDQIGAIGAQFCNGINNIASYYYQGNNHTKEEDLIFSAALGRMKYMVENTTHTPDCLVYYPYEGIAACTMPSIDMWKPSDRAKEMSDSFQDVCLTLSQKQIDYDLINSSFLATSRIENGKIITESGMMFDTIVIPYTVALSSSTVLKLEEAVNSGVKVIIEDFNEIVSDGNVSEINEIFKGVCKKSTNCRTSVAIAKEIWASGNVGIKLSDDYATTIYTSKRSTSTHDIYTIVNGDKEVRNLNFTLNTNGKSVKYYNTLTGEITNIEFSNVNGKVEFSFNIPSITTGFFVVEK